MRIKHVYMGVNYETVYDDNIYYVSIGNGIVTGTHSISRGEASMRFMIMLDEMLERESQQPMKGDLLRIDGKLHMIDSIAERYPEGRALNELCDSESELEQVLLLREEIGNGEINFRGPAACSAFEQQPLISLSSGPFFTRKIAKGYLWSGTETVEFSAWKETPAKDGCFNYKIDVNVWEEAE